MHGTYSDQGDYYSWQEGRQLRSTISTRGANVDLGYEKRREITVGLEATLFKKTLQINASYFVNKLEGIPIQATTIYPSYLLTGSTSFIPYINYNADQRQGFDLGVSFNKHIRKVDLNIGVVATYYNTKASVRSESYQYAYQNRQGQPIDALFGLRNAGFYTATSIAAIDGTKANPKPSFGAVKPGDIRYVDVNGDGIIDNQDQVYLGKTGSSGSPLTIGLHVTAKWNNFSFFVLANSGSGSVALKNSSYYWATAATTAKYSAVMLDRWTTATAATATYPRLTTTSGDNNYRNSDFWLYKNNRINLARVQLSYDVPKKIFARAFISALGLYINGNDLLCIAKEQKLMETNIGSAPQMRFFSIGAKATF